MSQKYANSLCSAYKFMYSFYALQFFLHQLTKTGSSRNEFHTYFAFKQIGPLLCVKSLLSLRSQHKKSEGKYVCTYYL